MAELSVILASASPRRRELLSQLGLSFSICPTDIDETPLAHERPYAQVKRLAIAKANACWNMQDASTQTNSLVLASDTLIELDGNSVGKPTDYAHSKSILTALSGRTHQVLTAVCAKSAQDERSMVVTTEVEFACLTQDQMAAYWHSGEPQDKAGSYAIQGLGGVFVRRINGSYSSVVGLPLCETRELLIEFGMAV